MRHILRRRLAIWLLLAMACWGLPARPQNDPGQAAVELEHEGKTAEAEAAWSALSKAHPTNSEPFAHLGLLEARQEHYTQAIALYRKAMTLKPAIPGLRLDLGLAYFKDGQYKQAIQTFTPLLKQQSPSSPEIERLTVLLGMAHYGLGEYAAAVPFLKKASSIDAQNLPLLLTLAHSCLLSKQYPCVLDAFHRMVALNAESAEADMLVGEALDEMKDPIGATREFHPGHALPGRCGYSDEPHGRRQAFAGKAGEEQPANLHGAARPGHCLRRDRTARGCNARVEGRRRAQTRRCECPLEVGAPLPRDGQGR